MDQCGFTWRFFTEGHSVNCFATFAFAIFGIELKLGIKELYPQVLEREHRLQESVT